MTTGKVIFWSSLAFMISLAQLATAGNTPPQAVSHASRDNAVLIRLASGAAPADPEAIRRAYGASKSRSLAAGLSTKHVAARWHRLEFVSRGDRDRQIDKLRRDSRIDYVEPDYQISASLIPSDPRFTSQWGLVNTGQPSVDFSKNGYPGADIDAANAWDIAAGDPTVVVAVLDSGVEYSHPDLAANMWVNAGEIPGNGVDDDHNGYVDDVYGYDFVNEDGDPSGSFLHGTAVAGVISSTGNNGIGMIGVGWRSKLMAVKCIGDDGTGYISDLIQSITYAVANGAKIINASLGSYSYSQALFDAIDAANMAGVLVVAASGNSNSDNDVHPVYPAGFSLPNIISVAATDRFDARAPFSNYGRNTVNLGAPGLEIYTTVLNGGYLWLDGTSMAAPFVAGAAAVLLSNDASLTPAGLKSRIEGHADSIPSMAGITTSGGRLNLFRSLTCDGTESLEVAFRSLKSGFSAYVGEPNQVQVFVANCGRSVSDATVDLVFDNTDGQLTLFDDGVHGDALAGDGVYGNIWFPQALGPVSATAHVSHGSFGTAADARIGKVLRRVAYRHEAIPYAWVDMSAGNLHALDDDGSVTVPIGFDFMYFGETKSTLTVSANGYLTFAGGGVAGSENTRIPSPSLPNDLVAVLWDDFDPTLGGGIYTRVDGTAPNRRFIVSWEGVQRKGGNLPVTFQAILVEATGEIIVNYAVVDFGNPQLNDGASASVGIESADGLDGTPYVFNQPLLKPGQARRFYPVESAPEVSYQVEVDLTPVRSTAGSLVVDFIDGDGINNNQFKLLEFTTEGDLVLNPELVGDATGSLLPGPARLGDAQFLNEITQPMIFGNHLSFKLRTAPAGTFRPYPDTLALYLLDVNQRPYPTNDPLGVNQLLSVEIGSGQPDPEVYTSAYATAFVTTVGLPTARIGGPYPGYINEPIQFDGTASTDPEGAMLTYFWSFGDGSTSVEAAPLHSFAVAGTYDVSLAVNDGMLTSAPAHAAVVVAPNRPPVAQAGSDKVVYGARSVDLDGSSSYDTNGAIVEYGWTQVAGPSVPLTNPSVVIASFSAPAVVTQTRFTFRLVVTDNYGDTATDDVNVDVFPYEWDSDGDGLPDGWEQDHFGNLSQTALGDPDGDGISNAQEYAEGTNPVVPQPAPQQVTGVAAVPAAGRVTVTWNAVPSTVRYDLYWGTSPGLTKATASKVSDVVSPYLHLGLTNNIRYYFFVVAANNSGESPESAHVSAMPGTPPIANPNGPYAGTAGVAVHFSSAGSYDPDGEPISLTWDFGDGATAQGANPTHAYGTPGTYAVVLTVSDGTLLASAQTIATIVANAPPVANANGPYSGHVNAVVQFDSAGSFDPEGAVLFYAWDFGDGASGEGANPTNIYLTPGVFTASLRVSDGTTSSTAHATVNIVSNSPPAANAGSNQTVLGGVTVQLDGTASTDADGRIVSFAWTRTSGPAVTLIGANTATPTFQSPNVSGGTTLAFQLTVTDDVGEQSSATVLVFVLDENTDTDADELADSWEIANFGNLAQMPNDDPDGDGFTNLQEFRDGTSPTVPFPIPAQLVLTTVPGDQETLLTWKSVTGALRYDLYWRTSAGVTPANGNRIAGVSSPYRHAPQTNGLPYYYTVVAVNNAGESAPASEAFSLPAARQWTTEATAPYPTGSQPRVAASANGDVMIVWMAAANGVTSAWSRRYTRAGGWEAPMLIESANQAVSQLQIAMDGTGNAFAVWTQWDGLRGNLYASQYVAGLAWGAATLLENYDGVYVSQGETGDIYDPVIAVNPRGQAVVAWRQEEARWYSQVPGQGYAAHIPYASYYSPGKGWSPRARIVPFRIGSDSEISVGIDDNGNAIATWRHNEDDDGISDYYEIHVNHYSAGLGWWAFSVLVPHTGEPECFCGPTKPVLSVAPDGSAALGFDNAAVLAYSPGQGWSPITSFDTTTNLKSSLKLTAGNARTITAAWVQSGRRNRSLLVRQFSAADGWGAATTLTSFNTISWTTKLAADGWGRPVLFWVNPSTNALLASRPVNGVWTSTQIASNARLPEAAMSYGGDMLVQWEDSLGAKYRQFNVPYLATVPPIAPIANAGPDQTVAKGTPVTLNGAASSDPDGTITAYYWRQLSGPVAVLNGATTASPTFTAPSVNKTQKLTFELQVTDNTGMTGTDQVIITVTK